MRSGSGLAVGLALGLGLVSAMDAAGAAERPVLGRVAPTQAQLTNWGYSIRSDVEVARSTLDLYAAAGSSTGSVVRDALCGCEIDVRRGRIKDPFKCDILKDAEKDADADIVAIPIVDRAAIARPLQCFRRNPAICQDFAGFLDRGVACCARDPQFSRTSHDPHLVVLVPRMLLGVIRNRLPVARSEISPGAKQVCSLALDSRKATFAFPAFLDGVIARASLYASRHYSAQPSDTVASIQRTSAASPPGTFERALSRAAARLYHLPQDVTDEVR